MSDELYDALVTCQYCGEVMYFKTTKDVISSMGFQNFVLVKINHNIGVNSFILSKTLKKDC